MPESKRGGARRGAGRHSKFTILQEWTIGGSVDEHIKRRVRRHFIRMDDEAFYKSNAGKVYKSLIGKLYAVDDKYLPPPGASLSTRMALTKEYRRKIKSEELRRHLKKISMVLEDAQGGYVPPPLPAMTPRGVRTLAIHAMVRLLRLRGHKVAHDTVEDYLERYRQNVRDRMKAESPLD
jgi:hypothetical protein